MISTSGVNLAHWHMMGIEDPVDLQWLMKFYFNQTWSISGILFELTEALNYYERRR